MEHEATALRAEVESKDQELTLMQQRYQESQTEITELKAELENNAGKLMTGGWKGRASSTGLKYGSQFLCSL